MNSLAERSVGPIDIQDLRTAPYDEHKSKYFRGQFLLAASEAFDWYAKRWPYIRAQAHMDGADLTAGRMKVYQGEIEEVKEARTVLEKIPNPSLREVWKLASEWADVMIVGASIMRSRRMKRSEIADIWLSGKYEGGDEWINSHVALINEYKIEADFYGLDLAEMVINKLAINTVHYDASLLPMVLVQSRVEGNRKSSFAREMRLTVGGNCSSQIPPMDMSRFGELWIDVVDRSPFGSNGRHPTAIMINDGKIELSDGDIDNTYDKLYAIGWLSKYGD